MRLPRIYQRSENPLSSLREFQNEIDRWMNERFLWPSADWKGWDFAPACDLSETEKEFLIKADLPGVKKEDVKIQVDGNQITIGGERKEEIEEGDAKKHHSEAFYGSFMRSFTLPQKIDEQNVSAEYRDGVLNVTIPKSKQRETRKIEIQ